MNNLQRFIQENSDAKYLNIVFNGSNYEGGFTKVQIVNESLEPIDAPIPQLSQREFHNFIEAIKLQDYEAGDGGGGNFYFDIHADNASEDGISMTLNMEHSTTYERYLDADPIEFKEKTIFVFIPAGIIGPEESRSMFEVGNSLSVSVTEDDIRNTGSLGDFMIHNQIIENTKVYDALKQAITSKATEILDTEMPQWKDGEGSDVYMEFTIDKDLCIRFDYEKSYCHKYSMEHRNLPIEYPNDASFTLNGNKLTTKLPDSKDALTVATSEHQSPSM